MERITMDAVHLQGGYEYTWLVPNELVETLTIVMKQAKFKNSSILALVENGDSVAIVEATGFRSITLENLTAQDHPFKKVLNFWVGDPEHFIKNYNEKENEE
ncbi:hypothetical protein CFTD6783_02295 [Campylobacter fetus subsp. testudinum]|uniref:hypothetical protein n=1 Tax=Campylobacter fetus TaxID=196 RepID=UPI000818BC22|nr:hypothetical protein [Campylobacter fetus]OCS10389.1 hypothetical protein CFTD6783_02295 [Campylobacter fetus subsp. testudinum]